MKTLIFLLGFIAFSCANPLAEGDAVIGITNVDLDAINCSKFECNIGNLIANSVRYSFTVEYPEGRISVGTIVLIAGSRITKSIEQGTNITDDVLHEILNHEDLIVKQLKGTAVIEALEHSVHQ